VTPAEADEVLRRVRAVLLGNLGPDLAWFVARDGAGRDAVAEAWLNAGDGVGLAFTVLFLRPHAGHLVEHARIDCPERRRGGFAAHGDWCKECKHALRELIPGGLTLARVLAESGWPP
jgi:hypothetical protein